MYARLKKLYNDGKISADGLQFWVDKGIITAEEKQQIITENN